MYNSILDAIVVGAGHAGLSISYHLKDLNLTMDLARELGLALPFTGACRELLQMGANQGLGEKDDSALQIVLERMSQKRTKKDR